MARNRLYRSGTLVLEDFPTDDISDHLADPSSVVWLDLSRPGPEVFAAVAREFGFHELALDDASQGGQRPKLDQFPDHAYLNAYAVELAPDATQVSVREVGVFLTRQALITIRNDDSFPVEEVVARWDQNPELAREGVGFLLYGLLDFIVDGHYAAVQQLDDLVDELEDLLFEEDPRQIREAHRRLYVLRRALVRLRRVVMPMREVVNTLMRPGLHVITDPLAPYFQDVYDHAVGATARTESVRDMLASAMETNMSAQSNRMNLIMKKVTSWAAIIAVPTAITGFYGQNLPYPGFSHEWGFATSSGAIVTLSSGLYFVFKRKDWL
ncbi:magnesium transporter [Streptomyces sp. DvalAA-14]|uniref:magnesium transporter CorA family protein n=1 Tax=unclassified Streptomyces TaxID=2593676 RepID=UPI00081B40FC|nr:MULTISPECIES: magnesium transporter CorA family protein [unclassified Streptomyces]MYS23505.1 magnesium transporter [Streptomyces sp. SID4948]SCE34369.1 magnesium transporter [Streptomyces sp. DvalAA-14]